MMSYFYTAAWVVVGGISLRQDSSPIELASSKDYRFLLTRDPDAFLSRVDESSAIGRLISAVLSRTFAAGLVVLGEIFCFIAFCPGPVNIIHYTLARRSRKLLLTTNTLLNAIAPAAIIGFRKPIAAEGISITL